MSFSWSIRNKLLLGVGTLVVSVAMLAFSGFRCVYTYRELARSITARASELPRAAELNQRVSQMRVSLSRFRDSQSFNRHGGRPTVDHQLLRDEFTYSLMNAETALSNYRQALNSSEATDALIADNHLEVETVKDIQDSLIRVGELNAQSDWLLDDVKVDRLDEELERCEQLSRELPTYLQTRMHQLAGHVRGRYRLWMTLNWVAIILSGMLLVSMGAFLYTSVFAPLATLVVDSQRIADGDFNHRVKLDTKDEVSQVGRAMNAMTARFQEIRDSLDAQVKLRTKEVIQNEKMASVGFLAAGVAHEINNPLASIAWCAESLESRVAEIIAEDDELEDDEHDEEITVLKKYLRRIQDEAFRCKGITDSLLDYSRMSDVEKTRTNLGDLANGVIEMVQHLGKYREKQVEFHCDQLVEVAVNPQEIKQVALNLITNGLDSLDPGGKVSVSIVRNGDMAEMWVEDNGCGMSEEVLSHLFEPFYTRRRDGQGTGLGLSITFRIVADHDGKIEAFSDGAGRGSRFRVAFPLVNHEKEKAKAAA